MVFQTIFGAVTSVLQFIFLNYWLYIEFIDILLSPYRIHAVPAVIFFIGAGKVLYKNRSLLYISNPYVQNKTGRKICQILLLWAYASLNMTVWLFFQQLVYYLMVSFWHQRTALRNELVWRLMIHTEPEPGIFWTMINPDSVSLILTALVSVAYTYYAFKPRMRWYRKKQFRLCSRDRECNSASEGNLSLELSSNTPINSQELPANEFFNSILRRSESPPRELSTSQPGQMTWRSPPTLQEISGESDYSMSAGDTDSSKLFHRKPTKNFATEQNVIILESDSELDGDYSSHKRRGYPHIKKVKQTSRSGVGKVKLRA